MMAIIVTCTCGKQFNVKEELAGKRGKCASCGRVLLIPILAPAFELEKASPTTPRACPTCREVLQPNAVICLNCGLDMRTGKQLPHAKSSALAAPSRPFAKAPASSARLWIALIAGGTCLAGVAALVAVFIWSQGAGDPGVAPPAVKNLLAKVSDISPDDVERYEKFLREPTFLNALGYQGALPDPGNEVREAINLGLEKPAVAALIKLIQEKKTSTDKADLLICGQSIKALGHFGSRATEANSLLAELQNYKDNAVGSAAKLALADIKGTNGPSAVVQPKGQKPKEQGGPDTKGKPVLTENAPAVKKLLAKVTAITPDHVDRYEKFLREPTFLNATIYQGILPDPGDEVRNAINQGLEKPAVAALIKLIQEKKSSTDKADLLICAQSLKALRHFGPLAREANSLLAELQDYQDNAVGSAAKLALADIKGKPQPPTKPPPGTVPSKTTPPPAGVVLLRSKFVDAIILRRRINPMGQEEDLTISAEPGRRLLWAEFKLTQAGLTTIDLTKLRAEDGAGGRYQVAGFTFGIKQHGPGSPRVSQLLRSAGLKGQVIPTFSGGSSSTESATLRIDASPKAITVNIKSGEAVVSFVFVVPANVTDLTIRDFAGGAVALGTPGGP